MPDTSNQPKPKVEWRESPTEGLYDLYVNGRCVDVDVAEVQMADALRRARVKP